MQLNSSGKKSFNPPSGNKGWRMCPGQELVVASQLNQGLCVELRDLQSSADGGVVALQPLTGGSSWALPSLSSGAYCLSICNDDNNHCTQGCQQSDCTSDDQTIRGNLDVGTKGPTDPDDKH
ncbi:hypothetical protein [Myxococcus stipitatus]|uniref:hypothetical protein n=1 Tax=Myxococcus stipitatus TaxID=83455 RepID=UPI0030D59203